MESRLELRTGKRAHEPCKHRCSEVKSGCVQCSEVRLQYTGRRSTCKTYIYIQDTTERDNR